MRTPAGRGLRTSNTWVRSYTSSKQLETGSREPVMKDGDELAESVGLQTHQDRTDIPLMLLRRYNDGTHVQTCLTEGCQSIRTVTRQRPRARRCDAAHVQEARALFYGCLSSGFHPETETFSCMSHLTRTPNRFKAESALLYVTITHDCCVTG